jgi:hypothetical protein
MRKAMIRKPAQEESFSLVWFRVTGVIILAMSFLICRLGGNFDYSVPQDLRPIPTLVLYLLIWFGAYFFALERVRTIRTSDARGMTMIWILFVGLVARIFFFPPHAIQETDFYRYFWDGQAVLQGANPYRLSPQEAYLLSEKPAVRGDPQVEPTFEYINFPDVKTIYPPFAQYLFAFSQMLSPWSVWGWKGMIFAADAMIVVILTALLGRLKLKREWIVLYAWSPLILKEFHNNLHLDIFALLFVCLMIYGVSRKWTSFSFAALACAVAVKWFALILLPLLLRVTWKTPGQAVFHASLFGGTMVLFYLPFVPAGHALWDGLITFSLLWKVNAGVFHLITLFFQSLSLSDDGVRLASRLVVALIFAAIFCVVMRWLWKKRDVMSFCRASLVLTASLFFLIPTGNPWYYSWIFPFLIFFPLRSLILFSGLVLLYYLDFYFMYQGQRDIFEWVRLVEYGLFFMALGWELWTKNRQSSSLFRSATRSAALQRP